MQISFIAQDSDAQKFEQVRMTDRLDWAAISDNFAFGHKALAPNFHITTVRNSNVANR